ncbi:hypothetical protein [Novosphingobium sp. P6W]|uniref:hypothetical protein n=1 Tax=Novosphingobium sp. P6W TaxID=1609758 RepID=UPI0013B46327|nr:hypothetical protein [Novosphingobium sp. P6W]
MKERDEIDTERKHLTDFLPEAKRQGRPVPRQCKPFLFKKASILAACQDALGAGLPKWRVSGYQWAVIVFIGAAATCRIDPERTYIHG